MEKNSAMEYISRVDWRKSRLGLERVKALLERLGNPQDKLSFIHVAGTNGKSSVCCMTASVLAAAGYRTGLYTSPYVNRFNERMQVNGVCITDAELDAVTDRVRKQADAMEDHPTEFELVTVIAFLWFLEKECDVVVLEVGLGGRLDATNAIPTPLLAIITTIALDHVAELGDTLEKIAAEKAGIIKPGGDVVLYPQPQGVRAVFEEACRENGARLTEVPLDGLHLVESTLAGQRFDYAGMRDLSTPLLGPYQIYNAATVITAVQCLRRKGWDIPEEAVRAGLAAARWPARFELVHTRPAVIVDGGHNPQGAEALQQGLSQYFPGRQLYFVVGVMADKDFETMFAFLPRLARAVFCVTPDNPRALPAPQLAETLRRLGAAQVAACGTVREGLAAALQHAGEDGIVCCFGSLYMAGEARAYFGLS